MSNWGYSVKFPPFGTWNAPPLPPPAYPCYYCMMEYYQRRNPNHFHPYYSQFRQNPVQHGNFFQQPSPYQYSEEPEHEQEDENGIKLELTEEAIEMFARTEKRRTERKKNRQQGIMDKQRNEPSKSSTISKELNSQKDDTTKGKMNELNEELYGNGIGRKVVESLEGALNTLYNNSIDFKHPTLWPHISLH